MTNGNYNKISGKKTLALVIGLILLIIVLSAYTVYLMLRRSAVITNSSYYEKPESAVVTPTETLFQPFPARHGD